MSGKLHGEALGPDEAAPYIREGYALLTRINGQLVGVMEFLYAWAIVVDLDEHGYDHRFCYEDADSAVQALVQWIIDGGEQPTGYIKRKG